MENDFSKISKQLKEHKTVQGIMKYVNEEAIIKQHRKQEKNKAAGIDGISKEDYEENLNENVKELISKMKTMSYWCQDRFWTRKRGDVIIVLYAWKGVFKVAKNKSYDEEFKKMIVELYESHTTTAANIVREYGIGSATLYKWVGQYGKIQTPDGEVTNNKEIKKLKKEINDLKIENEILKKAMAIFTQKQKINSNLQRKTKKLMILKDYAKH